jgi:hypothetical protein
MRIQAIRNPLCVSRLKRHYGFSCSNPVGLDSSTDRVKHAETIYAADQFLYTIMSDHVHPTELCSIKLKTRPVSGAACRWACLMRGPDNNAISALLQLNMATM